MDPQELSRVSNLAIKIYLEGTSEPDAEAACLADSLCMFPNVERCFSIIEDYSLRRAERKWQMIDSTYKHDGRLAFTDKLVVVSGAFDLYGKVGPHQVTLEEAPLYPPGGADVNDFGLVERLRKK